MTVPTTARATLSVGQLVRVSNPLSPYDQMTGRILRITGGMTLVTFTAWGTSHVVPLSDLVDAKERAA